MRLNRSEWAIVAAFSLSVVVTGIAISQSLELLAGRPIRWDGILNRLVGFALMLAVLVPPALFFGHRFRLDGERWRRHLAIHSLTGVSLAALHIALTVVVVFPLIKAPAWETLDQLFRSPSFDRLARIFGLLDLVSYWTIVGALHAVFYYSEARRRELAAARLQESLTVARLEALRHQLNPHFLFNTLNTLDALLLSEERNAARTILVRLSDLLRYTLDDTRPQKVRLNEELAFIDKYLEIEQVRFADRLIVERSIAPDTLGALVPSMILQPLVENAIVWGVSKQCGTCLLAIRSSCHNGTLRLEVDDNGPGFVESLGEKGIGLTNTEARLMELYGGTHRIEYGRSPIGGASVSIQIPLETAAR